MAAQAAIAHYAVQTVQVDATVSNTVTTYTNPTGAAFWMYFNPATSQLEPLGLGNCSIVSGSLQAPTAAAPSIATATTNRSLNTAYQISSLRAAEITCYVDLTMTSVLGTITGSVQIQYADDAAFTTNVRTVSPAVKVATGGILSLTSTNTITLTAQIPIGKYVKLVSASSGGTVTFSSATCAETLL
jgi:hypothetical protein